MEERYLRKKAAGLCATCGKPRGVDGTGARCVACAQKDRIRANERYKKREAAGLCPQCGEPLGVGGTETRCAACLEVAKAGSAKYRREYPGRVREAKKRYWKENKEQRLEYHRQWREANSDRWRLYDFKRRAAKGICTKEQLEARVDYYGGLCYVCGKPHEQIDHVVPIAQGGTNWPANLRPICREHNLMKSTTPVAEFLAGLE